MRADREHAIDLTIDPPKLRPALARLVENGWARARDTDATTRSMRHRLNTDGLEGHRVRLDAACELGLLRRRQLRDLDVESTDGERHGVSIATLDVDELRTSRGDDLETAHATRGGRCYRPGSSIAGG